MKKNSDNIGGGGLFDSHCNASMQHSEKNKPQHETHFYSETQWTAVKDTVFSLLMLVHAR